MADYSIWLWIALIVATVAVVWQYWHAEKNKREVVRIRTGSLGSGKTFTTVKDLIKDYKKLNLRYRFRKHPIARLLYGNDIRRPEVYSSIPLRLNKKKWSNVLKREHLLCQELFPEDCVPLVMWDEVGLSANQYSFKDDNIISHNINEKYQCLEAFMRFYRHFYGDRDDNCRVYTTDQATGEVCINIRRRFGTAYNLEDFHRWLGFMPFYKVNVRPMVMAEDSIENINNVKSDEDEKDKYYFGFLPYRWMNKLLGVKRYDSHCFVIAKSMGFVSEVPFDNWQDNPYGYLTNYCPDLRKNKADRQKSAAAVDSDLTDNVTTAVVVIPEEKQRVFKRAKT